MDGWVDACEWFSNAQLIKSCVLYDKWLITMGKEEIRQNSKKSFILVGTLNPKLMNKITMTFLCYMQQTNNIRKGKCVSMYKKNIDFQAHHNIMVFTIFFVFPSTKKT